MVRRNFVKLVQAFAVLIMVASWKLSHADPGSIDVSAEVVIVLLYVIGEMPPHIVTRYEQDLELFFAQNFQQSTAWPGQIENWNVLLEKQERLLITDGKLLRRHLAAQLVPLQTTCLVTAQANQTLGMSNFERLLKTTIEARQSQFLATIHQSESTVIQVFFKYVNESQVFQPNEEVTTSRVPDTIQVAGSSASSSTPSSSDGGLNNSEIVVIAVAASFFFLLFCVVLFIIWRSRPRKEDKWFYHAGPQVLAESRDPSESLHRSVASFKFSNGSTRSSSGLNNNNSPSLTRSQSDRSEKSRLGPWRSSSTRIVSNNGETLAFQERTSFRSKGSRRQLHGHPETSTELDDDSDSEIQLLKDTSTTSGDDDDDEEVHSSPMFYDEAGHSGAGGNPEDQESYYSDNSSTGGWYSSSYYDGAPSREVLAPPGRLGIVVETRLAGPVINRINDNSPLRGIVFEGDLIRAIDNVDVRAMSASDITSLMLRTSGSVRHLLVQAPPMPSDSS